jgi:hypothetical protein
MAEDASLDDFLGSGDDEDEQDTGPADPEASAGAADEAATADADGTTRETDAEGAITDGADDDGDEAAPQDEPSVTPATTTYAWSDEGTTCEACGEPTERRWHQDGALVCPACKEW